MLSQVSAVFTRLLRVGIYTAVYSSVALFPDTAFWTTWYGWLLALVFYDFCYYWLHRAGHESGGVLGRPRGAPPEPGLQPVHRAAPDQQRRAFWAGFSTCRWRWPACRRWCLAWWRWWTCSTSSGCTPSMCPSWAGSTAGSARLRNHRVHHAVNDTYVDRNYGGILIIWDRMFGSFREEGRQVRLRHAQSAQQLGPAVVQHRGVLGTGQGQLACPQLGGQAARVDQAAGLAAGGRGGAASQRPVRHRSPAALPPAHEHAA
jgi:hypothetical protein